MPTDTPQNTQDERQQYGAAFYEGILIQRLDSPLYVDLLECETTVARALHDIRHPKSMSSDTRKGSTILV